MHCDSTTLLRILKGFVLIDWRTILNILKAKLVGHQYKLCNCVSMLYATVLPGYSQSKNTNSLICIGSSVKKDKIKAKVKILSHIYV